MTFSNPKYLNSKLNLKDLKQIHSNKGINTKQEIACSHYH
jgi:hypothetical protein